MSTKPSFNYSSAWLLLWRSLLLTRILLLHPAVWRPMLLAWSYLPTSAIYTPQLLSWGTLLFSKYDLPSSTSFKCISRAWSPITNCRDLQHGFIFLVSSECRFDSLLTSACLHSIVYANCVLNKLSANCDGPPILDCIFTATPPSTCDPFPAYITAFLDPNICVHYAVPQCAYSQVFTTTMTTTPSGFSVSTTSNSDWTTNTYWTSTKKDGSKTVLSILIIPGGF